MLGVWFQNPANCYYGPCYTCTGDGTGTVKKCLTITIGGVTSDSYYYAPNCCAGLNGTFKLSHYQELTAGQYWCGLTGDGTGTAACVWYGRLPVARCEDGDCPHWLSVVISSGGNAYSGTGCRVLLIVTKEEPAVAASGTLPDWIASTLCRYSSLYDCHDSANLPDGKSLCEEMGTPGGAFTDLVGCDSTDCVGLAWSLIDKGVGSSWCRWDEIGSHGILLKIPACCCEDTYKPCCCDGSLETDEVRTIYATVAGVTGTSGGYYYGDCNCNCHNGWTWRMPLTWVEGSCTSAATPPCWPCGGTAELSIHLDKPGREITAVLGGVNFSATWDGRCSTITGTVLAPDPDYYGTGDGCDYANATITLAASAQETSEPPVGPISNWCSECPKPRLMYFTISELGTLPCSGTDGGFDLSFLNGTWPLEAQSVLPNAMAGCGESDNGAESCDIWWLDLSAFDGTIIGYVGGQPVTVIANPALPPPSLAIYFPYQEAGGSHLVYQIVIPATYSGVSIFVKGYGQFTSSLTDSIPCLGVLALNRDWTSDVWCSSICASSMHPTGTMSVEGSA